MYRLKELALRPIQSLIDDIERRIMRLESSSGKISGYTVTYNPEAGKLRLDKDGESVTFTKD